MKYDTLEEYREYLKCSRHLAPSTVTTYYNRLDNLLDGQSLIYTIENLDIHKIIENLAKIKYKNDFSQSKNAFLNFLEFQNISLSDKYLREIEKLEKNTRKKYRKLTQSEFKKIDQKIKYIRNMKLKLSYQMMIATGLRVFEVAQITPTDCIISNDEIHFSFVGKGGNQERVIFYEKENPILYKRLKERIEETEPTRKIFYSSAYLQKQAKSLSFSCHDLRRAYAKLEYKKTKSKEDVQKKLRHTNRKTTNIYLRSKIKL